MTTLTDPAPLWLALLDEDPGDADVTAPVDHGVLAMWRSSRRPHRGAWQADPRLADASGPACVVALTLAPEDARPIADDPAVVHARRKVLADGRARAVSLLTVDPVHVAGAITVARADRPEEVFALQDDPFGALWGSRRLRVGPGVFGAPVRPVGPSLERYSGRPWPYDRFS